MTSSRSSASRRSASRSSHVAACARSRSPTSASRCSGGRKTVEIDALYMTPSARGQGVGTRLLETALAAGGRDVAWIVAADEGGARELYERLGFVTVWRPHSFVRRPT